MFGCTFGRTLAVAALAGAAASATAQSRDIALPQQASPQEVAAAFGDVVNGRAAIDRLGDQLAAKAAELELTPAQLASRLMADRSLYVRDDLQMIYVCPKAPDDIQFGDGDADTGDGFASRGGGIPLDDFLSLNSLPGASKTIYLDFTGHLSVNNGWNHNINFPPYNTNGSSGSFSDNEKADIIAHWQEVAEDFAPFNVNVTTQDPGTAALIRSNGSDQNYGVRVIMTQITNGFLNAGGVALLNSFNNSVDTPCFVFNKGLGAGPMSASHEAGHTLGLFHDGLNGSEYHPGSSGGGLSSWGPIMGAPFSRRLVQWSNGDYPGGTSGQNDTVIFGNSANGLNVLADDYTDNIIPGDPIAVGPVYSGMIEDRNDADVFAITLTEPREIQIAADPAEVGPNVDLTVTVYSLSPFSTLQTFNPSGTPSVDDTISLDAGDYTFRVDGTFQSLGNGPVSDYGSIGTYTFQLTETVPPAPATISFPNGLPTELDENVATDIIVEIDPGTTTLIPGELKMFFGINFPPITSQVLTPTGGNLYTATLPASDCDDVARFFFTIEDTDGTVTSSPEPAGSDYSATVECDTDDCTVDVNNDGNVDGGDFFAWVAAFGSGGPGCDQNNDGNCDSSDFFAFVAAFGAGCP